MIRNLWKSDPSEASVRTALKLAGDLIQELIDLKAALSRTAPADEWEYSVGFDDPELGWTNDLAEVHDNREDAEEDFRAGAGSWRDDDQIVRRRKAGPWEPIGGDHE